LANLREALTVIPQIEDELSQRSAALTNDREKEEEIARVRARLKLLEAEREELEGKLGKLQRHTLRFERRQEVLLDHASDALSS
jgi:predicted nuclease with TOPRIM domain